MSREGEKGDRLRRYAIASPSGKKGVGSTSSVQKEVEEISPSVIGREGKKRTRHTSFLERKKGGRPPTGRLVDRPHALEKGKPSFFISAQMPGEEKKKGLGEVSSIPHINVGRGRGRDLSTLIYSSC